MLKIKVCFVLEAHPYYSNLDKQKFILYFYTIWTKQKVNNI